MLDAIRPLLESDLVNEETKQQIEEAWNDKLTETRNEVRVELREEFAQKYEHDKTVMVEALDRMVTEGLSAELEQIVAEKKQIVEDRAKFVSRMTETTDKFESFLVTQLTEEIKELHEDREAQSEQISKLEKFVVTQLAEELQEFQADREDVANTKVKLVKEARSEFEKLKSKFVDRSSKLLESSVTECLKSELTQLKEDINASKENNFGRKIFEAFVSEFSTSHLNENREIKELQTKLKEASVALGDAENTIAEKSQVIENKTKEVNTINESVKREKSLNVLLKPLNKEKSALMRDLLESTQTVKLNAAFERYLPAVLDGTPTPRKRVITENRRVVTGDKETKTTPTNDENVIELNRLKGLAGLK